MKSNCDSCGNCSRCGSCCAATLPLTRKEEKRIRKYIKENNITPEFFQLGNNINLQCCFYDITERKCKIYEVRPSICRSFKCNKNMEDIEKEKSARHKVAYWNNIVGTKSNNITDMRLLFYDDPRSLIGNLVYSVTGGTMICDKIKFEFIKQYLRENGQSELVNCIEEEYNE